MTNEAIDDLNEALRDAEDAIAGRMFGVSTEVDIDGESRLAFCKVGGTWGLYVRHANVTDSMPKTELVKASKRLRVSAALALPSLYEALLRLKVDTDRATREAAEIVKALTARIIQEMPVNESEDTKESR